MFKHVIFFLLLVIGIATIFFATSFAVANKDFTYLKIPRHDVKTFCAEVSAMQEFYAVEAPTVAEACKGKGYAR
jgi:hypothetical protein